MGFRTWLVLGVLTRSFDSWNLNTDSSKGRPRKSSMRLLCFSTWYVEFNADIAWPWYCAIGGVVSVIVGWLASVVLDGFQKDFHPYTVHGQKELFEREGRPEKVDGWYQVPGKVDRSSYFLLLLFALSLVGLWAFNASI
jgi:hypothetical protein